MIQIMYAFRCNKYDAQMKRTLLMMPVVLIVLCAVQQATAACTVCHSKNPKMVSMHKALQYKDCFKCHGPASDRKAPNTGDEMTTDPLCISCHASSKK
jgi:predicted CXXCH cytochrome family protein